MKGGTSPPCPPSAGCAWGRARLWVGAEPGGENYETTCLRPRRAGEI